MTTQQPEALKLAGNLEALHGHKLSAKAATELRRLHESNTELLEALQTVLSESHDGPLHDDYRRQARAAIAKAERTTT